MSCGTAEAEAVAGPGVLCGILHIGIQWGTPPVGPRVRSSVRIGSGSTLRLLIRRNRTTDELAFYLC